MAGGPAVWRATFPGSGLRHSEELGAKPADSALAELAEVALQCRTPSPVCPGRQGWSPARSRRRASRGTRAAPPSTARGLLVGASPPRPSSSSAPQPAAGAATGHEVRQAARAPSAHVSPERPRGARAVAAPGSAAGWLEHVRCLQSAAGPSELAECARALQHLPTADTTSPALRAAVLWLFEAGLSKGVWRATYAHTLATSVAAHPLLLADRAVRVRASALLDAGAADEHTFRNLACVNQHLGAQGKLQLHTARFWAEVERRGVRALAASDTDQAPRFLAVLAHRAATLASAGAGPPPGPALWMQVERAAAEHGAHMDGQQVSNFLWACGKLSRGGNTSCLPRGMARYVLLDAVASRAGSMSAHAVSLTLWALAALHIRLEEPQRRPLLRAFAKSSASMAPQAVSNSAWAFAKLGLRLRGQHLLCLQAAIARTAPAMQPQHVSNTTWALAKAALPLPVELMCAAERSAVHLKPQELSSLLWALAEASQPPSPLLRSALLTEVTRAAHVLNTQQVANIVWALGAPAMQGKMNTELRAAVLAALERTAVEMLPIGQRMAKQGAERLGWPLPDSLRSTLLV